MIGKPKFKIGERVSFYLLDKTINGSIYIIDKYGTFEDDSDVSYDILDTNNNIIYKHITESKLRKYETD